MNKTFYCRDNCEKPCDCPCKYDIKPNSINTCCLCEKDVKLNDGKICSCGSFYCCSNCRSKCECDNRYKDNGDFYGRNNDGTYFLRSTKEYRKLELERLQVVFKQK